MSLCNLERSVTAAAVGMSSNIYSSQFLLSAAEGTAVERLLLMICFCSGSSMRRRIRSR
ncbi:hypothetical protein EVA_15563 [gut metagenome]|uniref:Uncharacterized protein n=1 Tax=gut metagenome TaxID=749906 RepID=J9FN12_9ZZZZ